MIRVDANDSEARSLRTDIIDIWLAKSNHTKLTKKQTELLLFFQERLLSVNEYMNLTAITKPEDIAVKHFIDSFTLLPWLNDDACIIDIGTGAGFPGLPLKIMKPRIRLTLLDSLLKRIHFLRETVKALGLTEVDCLHGRAEEMARKDEYYKRYDVCTVRAVARMDVLAGYTLPFLKPGGLLLAMKGPDVRDEVNAARSAMQRHGGAVAEIKTVEIAEGMRRSVVLVRKR